MKFTKKTVAVILTVIITLTALSPLLIIAENLYWGSKGEKVKQVQEKLKRWGYYSGSIDGIYGSGTQTAVKKFQRNNGLSVDGIVGKKTAAAMGINLATTSSTGSGSSSSTNNLNLLARLVHGEARGEPYKGKVAVAAVVLNRVRSSSFPNSIAGVIYQSGAFDAVSDGQINLTPDQDSINAARAAMNGWDPTNGCLYYYNPKTATSRWMLSRTVLLRIGQHAFC